MKKKENVVCSLKTVEVNIYWDLLTIRCTRLQASIIIAEINLFCLPIKQHQ